MLILEEFDNDMRQLNGPRYISVLLIRYTSYL